jgi:hypothetical protein
LGENGLLMGLQRSKKIKRKIPILSSAEKHPSSTNTGSCDNEKSAETILVET